MKKDDLLIVFICFTYLFCCSWCVVACFGVIVQVIVCFLSERDESSLDRKTIVLHRNDVDFSLCLYIHDV